MSTQIPNTETTTPDYLLGVERGHMVRVPLTGSQPNDSASVAVVTQPVVLSGNYTVDAADDGKIFACSTALTITIPAGLIPRPSFVVDAPPTGNASIAVSGGAQINGATTTLTRSRASNPAGVAVLAHQDADTYGVSGS